MYADRHSKSKTFAHLFLYKCMLLKRDYIVKVSDIFLAMQTTLGILNPFEIEDTNCAKLR